MAAEPTRRRKPANRKSSQIITVVTPDIQARVDAVAESKGLSRSEVMRAALGDYLERNGA